MGARLTSIGRGICFVLAFIGVAVMWLVMLAVAVFPFVFAGFVLYVAWHFLGKYW